MKLQHSKYNNYHQSLPMRLGLARLTITCTSHLKRYTLIVKQLMTMQISNYQLSLELFKLYNNATMSEEWLHLNDQMLLGSRQTKFLMLKSNQSKLGMKS